MRKSLGHRIAPVGAATLGTAALGLILYAIQALGMQSFRGPIDFFLERWYFELPLVLGFGVQIGLFVAIRRHARVSLAVPAAPGGSSTATMVACCLHNFVPLITLLGIGGFATSLAYYQDYLFVASLVAMLVGTGVLWKHYRMIRRPSHLLTPSPSTLCH